MEPLVRRVPDDSGFRFDIDAGVYFIWIELDDGNGAVSLRLALDSPSGLGGPQR
jgi:hypothetical protein